MDEHRIVEWQMPPAEADGYRRKGFIDDLVQSGDKWVQSQPGTRYINQDIKLLMGLDQDNQLKSNSLQADIRTFVETISDLGQIATFGSNADQFKKTVQLYNDVTKFIFWDSNFVWKTRKALQYAMLGRGYLWTKFSREHYGWGKGRMQFDALGPYEVLPEQLPADNDIQGCYAVTIIRAMPIAEAHARFPQFQSQLKPISRYDWAKYNTLGGVRLDFWDRWRYGRNDQDWDNKYCEMQYTFIRDLRMNDTGRTIQMGVRGSTWGYEVPSYGDLIVSTNPFNGLAESRKADENDCRMYPQLRLVITNPSIPIPLYDDTAFDWHGEIPLAQYDVNDWAWSPMGYSAIRNVAGLEKARRARLSEIDEVLSVRKDPPTGYDIKSGVPRTQMEKLDLLRGKGIRIGLNGDPTKSVQSVLPESIRVDAEDWKGQEMYNAEIKASLGLTDIASMRDLKMNMSSESIDKMLENLGPMAKGIAVNMWMAHGKIANMLKYNIPQYISVNDLVGMVGPEGVNVETFDNDPTSLIPGKLPDEGESDGPSRYTMRQRSQWFAERLNVISKPTQILNITQQQERMLYMFFLQKGVPISMATTMEKLGVQGYDNEYEAWKEEQVTKAEWELDVKALLAHKSHDLGLDPPEPQGPGQGKGGGRPSTGAKPNKAQMKGSKSGNVRVVNSTS